jgi:hypothetical protein
MATISDAANPDSTLFRIVSRILIKYGVQLERQGSRATIAGSQRSGDFQRRAASIAIAIAIILIAGECPTS